MSSWPWTYTRVDESDPDKDTQSQEIKTWPSTSLRKRKWSTLIPGRVPQIILAVCVTAITVATGIYSLSQAGIKSHTRHHHHTSCGNSSKEALALGCSFDQLTWAWYPPHCPHYANEAFLNAEPGNPWIYYSDPYNKTAVTRDEWYEAIDNKRHIYGERREHLTHCVYMMLSVGQILRDGTPYAPILVSYGHLDHCSKVLLDALRQDTKWFEIETQVPKISYNQQC